MFRWLKKTPPPVSSPPPSPAPATLAPTSEAPVLRQYRLGQKLGEGGMGVVYEARDERLDRPVAIKRMRFQEPAFRERLLREARTAAAITHPNVCQVYELGEENGELYIVMELLAGETLAARIVREPLPLGEALHTTLGILAALEALHSRGIIHRDLKPSNVFLTQHGVKLLDFGLARPHAAATPDPGLTIPGMILGTPSYMAPETIDNEPVGPLADLFAVGAILFEMLTGKRAFDGSSVLEIYEAVAREQPPALVGGADVLAADRVIQRALAKRREDRYPNAAEMARDVREALTLLDTGPAPRVRTMTRVIVLPFRLLRPDAEIEFLTHSLPEAISASLAGLESVAVRSTAAAERYAGERPDLKVVAAEAGVDAVVLGSLLRAAEQVRVSIQLAEAPSGTLVTTRTAQAALTDIFQLQDDLTRQIVDALAIPLSAHDRETLVEDAPTRPEAYELYLRANHIAQDGTQDGLTTARELYRRCLELDPNFAPAWARLGRLHRVMAKFGDASYAEESPRAAEAFRKALELNPDLPLAHNLYTYFEIEEDGRPRDAMVRLLRQAAKRVADPDLLSGLVVACRFCGLLEASVAADRRARRIDPGVRTSVAYTHWLLGDYQQTMLTDLEGFSGLRHACLWMLGRKSEALEAVRQMEAHWRGEGAELAYLTSERAAFEGDRDTCIAAQRKVLATGFHDPEGLLFGVRNLAYTGAIEFALEMLASVVAGGMHCPIPLVRDPWFDSLRTEPEFVRLLRRSEQEHAESVRAYVEAGGERLLGVVG